MIRNVLNSIQMNGQFIFYRIRSMAVTHLRATKKRSTAAIFVIQKVLYKYYIKILSAEKVLLISNEAMSKRSIIFDESSTVLQFV